MSHLGIKLFASSVFTHFLLKRPSAIELSKAQSILEQFWVGAQNTLRDWGVVREIGDIGLLVGAISYCILQPQMGYRFYQLSKKTTITQYGPSPDHYLEVFHTNNSKKRAPESPSRVLVFVHGGGWGSGKPWMYRMIAEGLSNLIDAQTVVNVGYPVYPRASMPQQSDSMRMVLEFLRGSNGSQITVKPEDTIVFVGHSSGAHILALSLISSLQQALVDPSTADSIAWPDVFLGLAGAYDISKHYLHEAMRGVHQLSPMKGAAGGEQLFDSCSPVLLAQQLVVTSENQCVLSKFPKCGLLHGIHDTVVPCSSTIQFAEVLRKLLEGQQIVHSESINSDHGAIVTDLMFNKRTISTAAILEICNKCLN